jgi:hypothetical protein
MRLSAPGRRASGATATPDDIAAAIGELDRSYVEAAERNPDARESMNYLFAGFHLRLNVVGKQLAREIDKALCHLRAPRAATAAFTIEVWDESEVGSGITGARFESWDLPGPVAVSADYRHVLFYHPASFVRLDRRANRVVGCVRGLDALFVDERARPFHRQLSIMLNDRNIQFIHAGLLEHGGRGLLFVGKGGSGKTTTSVAGFLAGFGFLGEDLVGLEMTNEGQLMGHALYATCLIKRDHFSRFLELAAIGRPPNHATEQKLLVYLAEYETGRFAQRSPLNAVVLPRVVDADETSYRRAKPMDAMLSLAPLSVKMLPGAAPGSLEKFSNLVTTTPAFWLELGRNVGGIAPALRQLFDELPD